MAKKNKRKANPKAEVNATYALEPATHTFTMEEMLSVEEKAVFHGVSNYVKFDKQDTNRTLSLARKIRRACNNHILHVGKPGRPTAEQIAVGEKWMASIA